MLPASGNLHLVHGFPFAKNDIISVVRNQISSKLQVELPIAQNSKSNEIKK